MACVQRTFSRRRPDTCRVFCPGRTIVITYYSCVLAVRLKLNAAFCIHLHFFAYLLWRWARDWRPRYSWAIIIVIDRNVIAVVAHFICRGRILLCQHRNRRNEFMYRACDVRCHHDSQWSDDRNWGEKNKLPMMGRRVCMEHFAFHATEDQANATVCMQ